MEIETALEIPAGEGSKFLSSFSFDMTAGARTQRHWKQREPTDNAGLQAVEQTAPQAGTVEDQRQALKRCTKAPGRNPLQDDPEEGPENTLQTTKLPSKEIAEDLLAKMKECTKMEIQKRKQRSNPKNMSKELLQCTLPAYLESAVQPLLRGIVEKLQLMRSGQERLDDSLHKRAQETVEAVQHSLRERISQMNSEEQLYYAYMIRSFSMRLVGYHGSPEQLQSSVAVPGLVALLLSIGLSPEDGLYRNIVDKDGFFVVVPVFRAMVCEGRVSVPPRNPTVTEAFQQIDSLNSHQSWYQHFLECFEQTALVKNTSAAFDDPPFETDYVQNQVYSSRKTTFTTLNEERSGVNNSSTLVGKDSTTGDIGDEKGKHPTHSRLCININGAHTIPSSVTERFTIFSSISHNDSHVEGFYNTELSEAVAVALAVFLKQDFSSFSQIMLLNGRDGSKSTALPEVDLTRDVYVESATGYECRSFDSQVTRATTIEKGVHVVKKTVEMKDMEEVKERAVPKVPFNNQTNAVSLASEGYSEDHGRNVVANASSELQPVASAFSEPQPVASAFSEPQPVASAFSEPQPVASAFSEPQPVASAFSEPQPLLTCPPAPKPQPPPPTVWCWKRRLESLTNVHVFIGNAGPVALEELDTECQETICHAIACVFRDEDAVSLIHTLCNNSISPRLFCMQDKLGNTPLHNAVLHDNIMVAKELVGLDPSAISIRNCEHVTPLDIAVSKMNDEMVSCLLGKCVLSDPHGTSSVVLLQSCLLKAMKTGHIYYLETLLKLHSAHGLAIDFECADGDGYTAWHHLKQKVPDARAAAIKLLKDSGLSEKLRRKLLKMLNADSCLDFSAEGPAVVPTAREIDSLRSVEDTDSPEERCAAAIDTSQSQSEQSMYSDEEKTSLNTVSKTECKSTTGIETSSDGGTLQSSPLHREHENDNPTILAPELYDAVSATDFGSDTVTEELNKEDASAEEPPHKGQMSLPCQGEKLVVSDNEIKPICVFHPYISLQTSSIVSPLWRMRQKLKKAEVQKGKTVCYTRKNTSTFVSAIWTNRYHNPYLETRMLRKGLWFDLSCQQLNSQCHDTSLYGTTASTHNSNTEPQEQQTDTCTDELFSLTLDSPCDPIPDTQEAIGITEEDIDENPEPCYDPKQISEFPSSIQPSPLAVTVSPVQESVDNTSPAQENNSLSEDAVEESRPELLERFKLEPNSHCESASFSSSKTSTNCSTDSQGCTSAKDTQQSDLPSSELPLRQKHSASGNRQRAESRILKCRCSSSESSESDSKEQSNDPPVHAATYSPSEDGSTKLCTSNITNSQPTDDIEVDGFTTPPTETPPSISYGSARPSAAETTNSPQCREEESSGLSVLEFTNSSNPLDVIHSHMKVYSKCCPRHDIRSVVIGTTYPPSDAFGPKRRYSSIKDIHSDPSHSQFDCTKKLSAQSSSNRHYRDSESQQIMFERPSPESVLRQNRGALPPKLHSPSLVQSLMETTESHPSPPLSSRQQTSQLHHPTENLAQGRSKNSEAAVVTVANREASAENPESTRRLENARSSIQSRPSTSFLDSQTVPRDHKERIRGTAELLHAQDYTRILPLAYEGDPPDSLPPLLKIPFVFITGLAYYKLSNHKKSVQFFAKCLALADDCGRDGDITICNIYIGDIDFAKRRYSEAAGRYQTALQHYSRESVAQDFRMVMPTRSAVWLKCGSALKNASRVGDSVAAYEKAIEIAASKKDQLSAHTSLGNLYQGIGENGRAVKEYEAAIELAQDLEDNVSLGWNHGNLGNALLGLHQRDKALHYLFKALDMAVEFETTPQAIGRAYNNLGTAFQSLNELAKAEEHYDLALAQAIYGNDIPGQVRVYGNIGNLQMLNKESIQKYYLQGTRDLEYVIKHHEENFSGIKGSSKGLSLSVSLFETNSRTFHRMQDCMVHIQKGEEQPIRYEDALLVAKQSRARTLGELMLRRRGPQLEHELVSPPSLFQMKAIVGRQSCPAVYLSYTGERLLGLLLNNPLPQGQFSVQHHKHDRGKKKEGLQKIVVIPDSYTNLLPFTCVLNKDTGNFQIMPSLLTMGILDQLPTVSVTIPVQYYQQMLCVVGNPNIPHFNEDWDLGRLPHATKEAEQCNPILHEQATKDAVLMRIMNAKVIHLATHGSAVAGFLAFAGMTSSSSEAVDAKWVLIYPDEIESLNISPALVVLSSCDSGRGVFKADGIQGMARAFILAGAQAVLTALWRVPDESACIFMQFFYQYLVEGMRGTQALHKAILCLRCFSKYSQYIHWSGYQLTGRDTVEESDAKKKDREGKSRDRVNGLESQITGGPSKETRQLSRAELIAHKNELEEAKIEREDIDVQQQLRLGGDNSNSRRNSLSSCCSDATVSSETSSLCSSDYTPKEGPSHQQPSGTSFERMMSRRKRAKERICQFRHSASSGSDSEYNCKRSLCRPSEPLEIDETASEASSHASSQSGSDGLAWNEPQPKRMKQVDEGIEEASAMFLSGAKCFPLEEKSSSAISECCTKGAPCTESSRIDHTSSCIAALHPSTSKQNTPILEYYRSISEPSVYAVFYCHGRKCHFQIDSSLGPSLTKESDVCSEIFTELKDQLFNLTRGQLKKVVAVIDTESACITQPFIIKLQSHLTENCYFQVIPYPPGVSKPEVPHVVPLSHCSGRNACIVGNPTIPPHAINGTMHTFPDLPAATKEAKLLSDLFNSDPLIHEEATKEAVKKRLRSAQFVNISTHTVEGEGLVFSDKSLLTVQDIEELKFHNKPPALVVLNCCGTADVVRRANGMKGLALAFIKVGVSAVISIHGKVKDDLAYQFSECFYHNLIQKGIVGTLSFYKAMLTTRNSSHCYLYYGKEVEFTS